MKTIFSVLLMAALMGSLSANAASKLTINCDPTQGNSGFTISVYSQHEILVYDGSEMMGSYTADPSRDSGSYTAYKLVARDQDGQQPAEIKIENDLLSAPGKTAPIWVAPGIVRGDFTCTSTEAK